MHMAMIKTVKRSTKFECRFDLSEIVRLIFYRKHAAKIQRLSRMHAEVRRVSKFVMGLLEPSRTICIVTLFHWYWDGFIRLMVVPLNVPPEWSRDHIVSCREN